MMTYGEYQQYLVDGGWKVVSTHNEQIALLTDQLNKALGRQDELEERLAKVEREQSIEQGIGLFLVVAVVGLFLLVVV